MPQASYFDPYFEGMGAQLQTTISPRESGFDRRFECQQEFLQQRFINLVQTLVQNLATRMELLATKEEVQVVRDDLVAHIQNFTQFRQSHDDFATHFYRLYQPVTPGNFNLVLFWSFLTFGSMLHFILITIQLMLMFACRCRSSGSLRAIPLGLCCIELHPVRYILISFNFCFVTFCIPT